MLHPADDFIVRARAVRALVLDVDGVLTDASLVYGARGEWLKRFSARDGFAIKTAMQEGMSVAILSGRLAPPIKARITDLGIAPDHVIQGSRNKRTDITTLAGRLGLVLHEVAFMGDDLPDLPALTMVGLSACPADAAPEVQERCHFVAASPGGRGAVRDLIEAVLKARGRWTAIVEAWASGGPPEGFYGSSRKDRS